MLVKAIYCERMKCKGTLIWPAFLIIPVIPVLLGGGNYLSNLGLLTSEWYSLWTQVTLFYATFFFPPLIGTYCAFLWRYENFNSCRNTLFSAPVSYQTIYVSIYPGLSHDLTDPAVVCSPVRCSRQGGGAYGTAICPYRYLDYPRHGRRPRHCGAAVLSRRPGPKLCHTGGHGSGRGSGGSAGRQFARRPLLPLLPDASGYEFQ
ncbi:ABC transporter permease [Enterocloster bolteae]|uniref:ABC transporter permease n=1 Tax=Enterocloster bolteae TaxID=208479 RepID=UPI003993BE07